MKFGQMNKKITVVRESGYGTVCVVIEVVGIGTGILYLKRRSVETKGMVGLSCGYNQDTDVTRGFSLTGGRKRSNLKQKYPEF